MYLYIQLEGLTDLLFPTPDLGVTLGELLLLSTPNISAVCCPLCIWDPFPLYVALVVLAVLSIQSTQSS